MEVLKIEWYQTFDNNSKGYMELKVDKFFPCTAKTATKVFHLVRRWCSDEQISELEQFFLQKVEESDKAASDVDIRKRYSRIHQQIADDNAILESKKYSNGIRICPETFDVLKIEVKRLQKEEKEIIQEMHRRKILQVKWCRMLKLFYSAVSDILPTKK